MDHQNLIILTKRKMKIEVEEKTKSPAIWGPRIMIWTAGIIAAPFSGGLSLAAIAIGEAGLRHEKGNASRELDSIHPTARKEAERAFQDVIKNGGKQATFYYDSPTDGWGHVSKEIHFSIEDD